jgi:hypothetical protein
MFGGLVAGFGVLFLTVSPAELFRSDDRIAGSVIVNAPATETVESVFAPQVKPISPALVLAPAKSTPNQGLPTVLSFKKALQKLSGSNMN